MAAFSYEHHPFLLDNSFFLPSSPIKIMSNCLEENINSNGFSHFYPHESIQEIPADFGMHESSFLEHSSKGAYFSHNEANSLTKKQIGTESSTVVDKLDSGDQVIQKAVSPMMKKMNNRNGASLNCAQPKDLTEGKTKKQKKCNGTQKEDEKKPKAEKEGMKDGKEPPTGYIHVRARRGQATDSHSLAERLRREKISERMKILQGLVPGCDKVTGKALMLDEIINYVQSLQNQVEFLSMKLGSVNDPMFYDLGLMKLERLTRMASPLSTGHATHCSPMSSNQPTTANNYYPIIHVNTASPNAINANANVFSQDIACIFSEVEDQRQNFLVPSEFGNNLCFFH